MYVLKIIGVAGVVTQKETTTAVGQWVKSFDVDAHDGRGDLVTTANLDEAQRFPDTRTAFAFYQRQSRVTPVRPDGKPNRPLTAFHVTIEPLLEGPS